jgi:hypothetical protein
MYDHGQIFNQAQPFDGLQFNARLDQVFRNGGDRIYLMFERIHQTLGELTDRLGQLDSRFFAQAAQ